jgi:hypothetical protein
MPKSFVRLLVVAGLFAAVVIAGLIGSLRTGNYVVVPIVFTALGVAVVAVMASQYRVRLMLRDRSPDRLIAHYHQTTRRIPNADAAAAYLSAIAALFFGQFDRAHDELNAVNWADKPAMYRGHRKYVLALLALFEEKDNARALNLAAEARELEGQDPAGGLQRIDDVIQTIASEPADEVIARMEKTARKQHGIVPAMCAWALALYYNRKGLTDKAADFKQLVKIAAPHSAPLTAAVE